MIANQDAIQKVLKNNILALGAEAKKEKQKDPEVINATIGMLMDEKGKLYVFDSVNEARKELSNEEQFAYSNISGTPVFKSAIEKWIFGSYLEDIQKEYYTSVIPTPGGSGALSLIFENYVERGQKVLLPKQMWENYLIYANDIGFKAEYYQLFDGEKFAFERLKKQVLELKKEQDKIAILLNDPCQNPTGFCMDDNDYDNLVSLVNENKDVKFVIIMDVAYFDFYNSNPDIIRARYAKLSKMNDNAIIFFCFSGSKSFGLYGLRIGALLALTRSEEENQVFFDSACYSCRSRWSSATTYGISLISKLILDDKLSLMFKKEVEKVCLMLERRSNIFLNAAKEMELNIYPYQKGFFICVPYKDPELLMKELYKDKVRSIPTKEALRIAICAINEDEAKRLPRIIQERIKKLNEEGTL